MTKQIVCDQKDAKKNIKIFLIQKDRFIWAEMLKCEVKLLHKHEEDPKYFWNTLSAVGAAAERGYLKKIWFSQLCLQPQSFQGTSPAAGIHTQNPYSPSAQHFLVHTQHNFSKMQITAVPLDLPRWDKLALWAGFHKGRGNFLHISWLELNHKSPYLWRVMLHLLQASNTTISHCNPTLFNCETAKCYQISLCLASGKTHNEGES